MNKEVKRIKRVIISGGGTGGHVFPAIAIADALKRKVSNIEIMFVGAKGKLEMEKVPKAGYPIKGLWISGFQRKFTLRNLMFPFKVISSLLKARRIVGDFKPDAVVGVGGYASYPVMSVASGKGIPTLIQEQNSYAGVSNKMLKSKADKVCVAYKNMERYFPKDKIVMTGNPVRNDLLDVSGKREEGLKYFDLDTNKKTIVLVGGSLGAKSLNVSMASNEEFFVQHPDIQILWQVGKLYIDEFSKSATAALPNVRAQAFIDRMDLAYAMADVVICRAGALTISELCLLSKPAVLVPSPNVAEDHQTKNAMALVQENAAILVKDKLANEMLSGALRILENETLKQQLSINIKQLARPNAADDIAEEVLKLIDNQ